MTFTEEYFQGEERDGFYVKSIMKRAWAAQLEVLNEIDRICRHHHIRYFAWFGTLLGAVRHQGFIPWDDDMDLAMLRGDYERFLHYAETELPEGWYVSGTQPTIIRIMNSGTIRTDEEFLNRFHGCPYMMGVDIFCLDSVPKNKKEEKIAVDLFWAAAYLAVHWDSYDKDGQQAWEAAREEGVRKIEEITGYHFDGKVSVREQLAYLADRIIASYWDGEFEEATRIFRMHEEPDYRLPRSCFDSVVEVPFENMTIPILKDYDVILRLEYGDNYMTPLKECPHSYPFFMDQVKTLKRSYQKRGEIFPECFEWEERQ